VEFDFGFLEEGFQFLAGVSRWVVAFSSITEGITSSGFEF
jgi:hypothetical protein